jgi:pyruvate/2-oxoglutarate dehydrogenase complex dihydrolipoamide acyltransferase (E2) component
VASVEPEDVIKAFLADQAVPAPGEVTPFSDIQAAWKAWCASHDINHASINLGHALREAGYEAASVPGTRRRGRVGLKVVGGTG